MKDIPVLADYFLNKVCIEENLQMKVLTRDAKEYLKGMRLNGNARELKHIIEKAAVLVNKEEIDSKDLMQITSTLGDREKVDKKRYDEKEEIIEALKKAKFKIGKAAEILGINRSTLFRKMKRLNINIE